MEGRLKNKIALITGGGTGIGEAMAKRFHSAGASVAITGRRLEPLQDVAGQIGGLAIQSDSTIESDCFEAVNLTKNHFGGIDILVANAGITLSDSLTNMTSDSWNDTLRINLTGVMQIAQATIPLMLERGGGAILNISSVAGLMAGRHMTSYVTSKHAVIGLTRAMAMDYSQQGIRVNTLCPGWVETPMSRDEMNALAEEKNISYAEAVKRTIEYLPLNRMAKPEEIAACAEFLVSDDASFVTGASLVADGGGHIVDIGVVSFQLSNRQ